MLEGQIQEHAPVIFREGEIEAHFQRMLRDGARLRVIGVSARGLAKHVARRLVEQDAERETSLRAFLPGIELSGHRLFVKWRKHAPYLRIACLAALEPRGTTLGRVPETEDRRDVPICVHRSASMRKVPRDTATAAPPSRTACSRPSAKSISSASRLGRPISSPWRTVHANELCCGTSFFSARKPASATTAAPVAGSSEIPMAGGDMRAGISRLSGGYGKSNTK